MNKKPAYLGSVRFFKHVILLTLALMILLPTGSCIVLVAQGQGYRTQIEALTAVVPSAGDLADTPLDQPPVEADAPPPDPVVPAAAASEAPSWEELLPELYAQPAERSSVDAEKTVYLTFDDGPSALTPKVLEILDHYNVKATFFVVGKQDEQSLQTMRDIVAAGHTLGMHSYSHNYKEIYASPEAFLADYNRIYQLIYDTTGVRPQVSRFPGGSINGYNASTYHDIIAELVRRGFVYFDWNVSSGDAAKGGTVPASALLNNATSRLSTLRRAVVLMHDSADKTTTVAALPSIIEAYQKAGFTFAALTPEVTPVAYAYPE